MYLRVTLVARLTLTSVSSAVIYVVTLCATSCSVMQNLRFLRIHKPLFSLTVLKNEVFNVLKHCVCSGDTQSGQCATLVLRNITPCQKP